MCVRVCAPADALASIKRDEEQRERREKGMRMGEKAVDRTGKRLNEERKIRNEKRNRVDRMCNREKSRRTK